MKNFLTALVFIFIVIVALTVLGITELALEL